MGGLFNDLGHRLLDHGLKKSAHLSKTSIRTETIRTETRHRDLSFEAPKPIVVERKPSMKEAPRLAMPHLSPDDEAELDKILARKAVTLWVGNKQITHSHGHEGEGFHIKLRSFIDFKKVHRTETPHAELANEKRDMDMITDVAEIMQLFPTCELYLEGHTKTQDDKIDDWAKALALNRAEKVKSIIAACGIDPRRMETKGMPGHMGDMHNDVKIKIKNF